MYYTSSKYRDANPTVEYSELHDAYTIKMDAGDYLILKQPEIEYLYHEILGAMMHRRYSREEVNVKEELWAK
jgi:hypothetical protein